MKGRFAPTDEKHEKIRRERAKTRAVFSLIAVALFILFGGLLSALGIFKQSNKEILVVEGQGLKKSVVEPSVTEGEQIRIVSSLDAEVRKIKQTGVIMETDKASLAATSKLQEATRKLLAMRYGPSEPYRVEVMLQFQKSTADTAEHSGPEGSILLEMAPSRLVPHSVFSFLEIARQWQGGAFHRIAGHVLQVMVQGHFRHLAFQEYSKEYPHKKGTVGYAGRPSGPAWYVSIQDNTGNHGPGSQQKHNPYEADSCFGRVIRGFEEEVQRIAKIPDKGFINDKTKHVLIKRMRILVPGSGPDAVDGYIEWKSDKISSAS